MDRLVVISGCSGGGKSTLLSELHKRGHATVEEPGRRIITEELAGSGKALPWINIRAFAERAIEMALRDRTEAAKLDGWVFFDRGLIDAATALEYAASQPVLPTYRSERYFHRVFMAPPWPEIYVQDSDRQHSFDEAVAEYDRLLNAFQSLGYDICILPKSSVSERADFLLATLGLG